MPEDEDAPVSQTCDSHAGFTWQTATIFGLFCLGVQVFMAYNAGATTGSIEIIQTTPPAWNDVDLGFLAAMDKVGMTISSPIWGYLLQFWEPKALLALGLGINAGATLVFAFLRNHPIMLLAKLSMGFTEGLQWVWSQIWIVKHAGGIPLFLNLNGVSAGAGTVLGTAVSGFSTANGYSYGLAFTFEGFVLLAFWFGLLCVGKSQMRLKDDQHVDGQHSSTRLPVVEVLKMLFRHPLYTYTALAFAFDTFVQTGCQFLWTRIFMEVWPKVDKNHATLTLLLIPTVGSVLGAVVGSNWKFNTPELVVRTLRRCTCASMISVIGAGMVLFGMCVQMADLLQVSWLLSLSLSYAGFILVYSGIVANMGAVVGICTDSIEDASHRGIAVGLQQALNNGFGLTLSPLFPQLVMSVASAGAHIPDDQETSRIIFWGAASVLCGTGVMFVCCLRAWLQSRSQIHGQSLIPSESEISVQL